MEKQNLSKIDLQTRPKYQVFNFLMLMGRTRIVVNPAHPEVDLPDYLMTSEHVALEFGYDLPKPIDDLTISPLAIEATLSFNELPYGVFIPWEAVEAITNLQGAGVFYGKLQSALTPDMHTLPIEPSTGNTELSAQMRRRAFKVINGDKK